MSTRGPLYDDAVQHYDLRKRIVALERENAELRERLRWVHGAVPVEPVCCTEWEAREMDELGQA